MTTDELWELISDAIYADDYRTMLLDALWTNGRKADGTKTLAICANCGYVKEAHKNRVWTCWKACENYTRVKSKEILS